MNGLRAGGGTELSAAMGAFLGSRRKSMPTAAFILTDGEVHMVSHKSQMVHPCLNFPNHQGETQKARKIILDSISTSPNTPLRLFILGIGHTVSSDACEILATTGGGQYLLALSQESILLKCTSLLRAGRTSMITGVSVDWTPADISSGHGLTPQPLIEQSPPESSIPEMYPSSRSSFFAIIHTGAVPKQVVIRGKVDGKDVSISVDVESVKFGGRLSDPPFIHTLTAHRLIRDLENGSAKGKQPEITQRREIVRLGEYYQLASSHTSFVAVDYGEVNPYPQTQQKPSSHSTTVTSLLGTVWQYFTSPTALFPSPTAARRSRQDPNVVPPGGWYSSDSAHSEVPSESENTEYSDDDEDFDDWASDDTFSTLSSLESHSSVDSLQGRRPERPGTTRRRARARSPQAPYAPPPKVSSMTNRTERFKAPPINPGVATLVQKMSISGSFALTDDLGTIVGKAALEEARSWGDEELAATALAMVYLEKSLGDHLEVCQLLMEKGMEFVRQHPNGEKFSEMLDRARVIIQF